MSVGAAVKPPESNVLPCSQGITFKPTMLKS